MILEKEQIVKMLQSVSKEDALNWIRKELRFEQADLIVHELSTKISSQEDLGLHYSFDMSGYDGGKTGSCTVGNIDILNKFAYLGLYDATNFLFLDFYKGTPTLYWQYFGNSDGDLHTETFSGFSTSEIIYEIFLRTIFTGFSRRRD